MSKVSGIEDFYVATRSVVSCPFSILKDLANWGCTFISSLNTVPVQHRQQ